ncbi:MAG: fibronectin/fibrinogen-binding protein, partial [Desulfurella multipotens]
HLIIKNPQRLQQLDKTLLEKCAQKIRENLGTNDKIEVDYTFVKFVKKPKGFKKGRVTYSNFKTVVVG